MRECPISTDDEKWQLLKDFRDKRSALGRATGRIAALNNPAAVNISAADGKPVASTQDAVAFSSGRYPANLADTVNVMVNGDYGEDHAALSDKHLQQCAAAGLFIQVLPLRKLIHMHIAMGADNTSQIPLFSAKRKACISTTLQTTRGPLRFRNVEFWCLRNRCLRFCSLGHCCKQ